MKTEIAVRPGPALGTWGLVQRVEDGPWADITAPDAFDTEAKALGAKAWLMGPDFYRPPSLRRHYK